MYTFFARGLAVGAAVVLLATSGCSKSELPVTAVTGTVTLDDKPLAGAQVVFYPNEDRKLDISIPSSTNATGAFTLARNVQTEVILKPGTYRVLVGKFTRARPDAADKANENPEADPDYDEYRGRNILPPIYNHKQKSPIVVEIKPGENDVKVELRSKPSKDER